MTEYRHVMLAVDQTDDAAALAARGLAVARRFGAKLTLMHVVDQRALIGGGEVDIPLFGLGERAQDAAAGKSLVEPQPGPRSTSLPRVRSPGRSSARRTIWSSICWSAAPTIATAWRCSCRRRSTASFTTCRAMCCC